jgi:type IV pilus assembly protein PilB
MSGKLGDILIAQGFIDPEKLNAALSDQRAFGGKLGRTLVDLGYIDEQQLVKALAEQLDLDTVDLDSVEIEVDALSCLAVDTCERYGVFPIKVDSAARVLWVATAEPDRQTLGEVAAIAQYTLEPVLASMSSIDRAVRKYYFGEKMGHKHRLGEPLLAIPADAPLAVTKPAPAAKSAKPHDEAPLEDLMPEAMVEPEPNRMLGSIPPGNTQDTLQEIRTLLIRLEKNVNAQARAFRALVDLLQDKGVVRRGELGARTSNKK